MIFHIDPAGAKPVYQQLMDQIKLAIAGGRLRAGDRLPTVRELAAQLRVNRNTISRVYTELERESVLYTRTGSGTFVSDQVSPFSIAEQRRHLSSIADDLIAQASLYGYSEEDLVKFFSKRVSTVYGPDIKGTKPATKSSRGNKS